METKYLRINPADNVAVAIVNLPAGEHLSVDGIEITLNEDIPAGHKFALKNFAEGENVIKYGYPIGHARMAKKQGDWMTGWDVGTFHPVFYVDGDINGKLVILIRRVGLILTRGIR